MQPVPGADWCFYAMITVYRQRENMHVTLDGMVDCARCLFRNGNEMLRRTIRYVGVIKYAIAYVTKKNISGPISGCRLCNPLYLH